MKAWKKLVVFGELMEFQRAWNAEITRGKKRMTLHSKEGIKLCRALKSYINVFVFILIIMRNNLRHFHFMVDIGDSCMKLLISFLLG